MLHGIEIAVDRLQGIGECINIQQQSNNNQLIIIIPSQAARMEYGTHARFPLTATLLPNTPVKNIPEPPKPSKH